MSIADDPPPPPPPQVHRVTNAGTPTQAVVEYETRLKNFLEESFANVTATSSIVGNLPAASASRGMIRLVTNATVNTRQTIVVGGGANIVLVYSDGTNWIIV